MRSRASLCLTRRCWRQLCTRIGWRAELSPLAARRAVTYLLVFPASFFLSAVYPDSLFLLCSVGVFSHARRRQRALAGVSCELGPSWHAHGASGHTVLAQRDRLVMVPSLLLLPLYGVMFVNGIYAAI